MKKLSAAIIIALLSGNFYFFQNAAKINQMETRIKRIPHLLQMQAMAGMKAR